MTSARSNRRKKHQHDEHESHERWVISYADFITLLFAFFVVMYSISSVNEGKYRVLSDALVTSFSKPIGGVSVIDLPNDASKQLIKTPFENQTSNTNADIKNDTNEQEKNLEEKIRLDDISGKVEREFFDEITHKNISVKSNGERIEIEIKSSLLFPSGSADLNMDARPVLNTLAGILKDYENPIQVEGFTDNVPISTDKFPSNWALSSARAVSVVQMLMDSGIFPSRLAAIGYGEFQPVADNNSEEGRKKNRRVMLIISKGTQVRNAISNKEALESYFSKERKK